ncbi:S8 family peptidase [Clostridium butanoliproducens]|uniref:S8 family peptidase n=1 Tax=Clostridium butanoliproducens TaxID=2991837 RepID=UPI0024B8BAD1|nr:S8 family peptidase [Clostridium butanoliproducens]MDU1348548.1 S8 family peptidase [Clostridium argentinense]
MGNYRENVNQTQQGTDDKLLQCGNLYVNDNYESYIANYEGDIIAETNNIDYACAFIIGISLAVVVVEKGRVADLMKVSKTILRLERNELYSLTELSPIDTSNISTFHENPYLTLRGNSVVVGMLDTGIDYLNKEFINENNTTRIIEMWDQSIQDGPPPEGFPYGTKYTREQINEAILAQSRGEDPYSIVPEQDTSGHGTGVAGIIGAGGRAGVTGAAPECEFVIVKLKVANRAVLGQFPEILTIIPQYQSSDVLMALKYLYETQRRLNKPMVICVAIGSNYGGHDGTAHVERYIDFFTYRSQIAIVGGTGNEGDAANHTSGKFTESGETIIIELQVADDQIGIEVNLWFNKPDKISVGIISPSGEALERIPEQIEELSNLKFTLEGTTVSVLYDYHAPFSGDEHVSIEFNNIRGGIWQIVLMGDYIVDGRYNAWTYQKAFLKPGTKFLKPNPYITLTNPSTSREIIVTSYYNQDNSTAVALSGRGFTRDGRIKPSVATGGIDVLTTKPGGGTTTITGSSAATAVLTGAVALILQWGIVEENNPVLYPVKINTMLISGTRKRSGDIYPNPVWGYGILDLSEVFKNIRYLDEDLNKNINNDIGEFTKNVIIRIPEELYR